MQETIELGELAVRVIRKSVKHVHLSVHPPHGRVTLTVPLSTRLDVARAYTITRVQWIRKQQEALKGQARETPRRFVERESHFLWGRRHLLSVEYRDEKPSVRNDHRRIFLTVRPGSETEKRAQVIHSWHKALLHDAIPPLIKKWEAKLGVIVSGYYLQRMKTKWGACNPKARRIRINTEMVKKPKDLLEYVVVHEMAHLKAPTHSEKFVSLMDRHFPSWREARAELNELPLASETWRD